MEKSVGILGAGAWGTAMAKALADKGLSVQVWSFEEDVALDINKRHANERYVKGIALPENVSATMDMSEAVHGKEYLIVAIPSLYVMQAVRNIIGVPNIMEGETLIGVLTKGFVPTPKGPRLLLDCMEDYLPGFYKGNLVYISGPSHAEEVIRGKITGLISASQNGRNSIRFRELLSGPTFTVFSSFDTIGVQTCAAVKNVIAIAFGVLDALKELTDRIGDNTESLLLAAGIAEIQALGTSLGSAYPETFTSIAGVGDLDVTCRSQYGRNRRLGREIVLKDALSRFEGIDDLLSRILELGYLPEGVAACKYANIIAQERNLKLPIIAQVHRILNREIEAHRAVDELLSGMGRR